MGWLDKAKSIFGIADDGVLDDDEPRAALRVNPRVRRAGGPAGHPHPGRPPLDGFEPAPQETLQDVLAAREAGDLDEMRRLLAEIDRGHGLRLVLRASAALEAQDEHALEPLLERVRGEEPRWKLQLQLAAALGAGPRARALESKAKRAGAPVWAMAWIGALSSDDTECRRGLVDLLFADPSLARIVAARDLAIAGVEEDPGGTQRYVSFAHGRDCIRRFGPELVDAMLDRAFGDDA